MQVAAGALSPPLRKLGDLLMDEFTLSNRVKKDVKSLRTQLEMMYVFLHKVGDMPAEQLDPQVRIWADKVRELSYNMEDAVDAYMVHLYDGVHGELSPNNMKNIVNKFIKRTKKLFSKGMALHQISGAVRDAKELAKELGGLRQRYALEARAYGACNIVDPRMKAVYKDITELLGIEETWDELIEKLIDGDGMSRQQFKTLSIVGFGGLGKTTLSKAVYDKIIAQFDCGAFCSVSRNPNMTNIFKKMLYVLDRIMFAHINEAVRDNQQLIDELRAFLHDKRYLIVIDDIWSEDAWEIIKCAFSKMSLKHACCPSSGGIIHNIKSLDDGDSRRLFNKRIFSQGKGSTAKDMQRILSFSYYDLPSHLKTCLLYLGLFPEDHDIRRDRLIWRWIAEGFIQAGEEEIRLFELGERYFNELININLIQPIYVDVEYRSEGCRVHDMVLDLICSLSSGENFVTILDGTKQSRSNSDSMVRRLSFQNSMSELTTHRINATSMSKLRSVTLFRTDVNLIQTLSNFQLLRILDLEGCDLRESSHICVENLLHLRYLGLLDTYVGVLPMKIGKLHFLQTLDLRIHGFDEVPPGVARLRHLMCLYVYTNIALPVGIGNLVSLEQLNTVCVGGNDAIEKELGKLMELRVLGLFWKGGNESVCDSLLISLANLRKLHRVDRVRPEVDIQILGNFPALRSLRVRTTRAQSTPIQRFIIGADTFPCLRDCGFYCFQTGPSMFPRGSMPRLKSFNFFARASHLVDGDMNIDMRHLPFLQKVTVCLLFKENCLAAVQKAVDMLELALDAHPNRTNFHWSEAPKEKETHPILANSPLQARNCVNVGVDGALVPASFAGRLVQAERASCRRPGRLPPPAACLSRPPLLCLAAPGPSSDWPPPATPQPGRPRHLLRRAAPGPSSAQAAPGPSSSISRSRVHARSFAAVFPIQIGSSLNVDQKKEEKRGRDSSCLLRAILLFLGAQ
ncbi:disease resistance protein RGA5-like [Triticum aestivum]|uniref:disease resistance protein RGA5-like n=1 Tax=Triticum aestivum TaxID=4565 RepID=UPI001D005888|nr:disease resistance protein RGA5-like [Triticum aestivum]